jgi:hypothetical protein
MYVERNIEARSAKHCCGGKAVSITYSECVSVALVIQHTMRMRPIIMSSGLSGSNHICSTLAQKRHEHKMCVWISLQFFFFETFLILRRIQ